MREIAAFIHGIYPRSEKLVAVTRDVDRKRKTDKELHAQQRNDFLNLIKLQESLSFDYIEDGKFSWQDIFRPIIEATDGLTAGTLCRWFDNNTFFRQPVVKGKLKLDKKKLDFYFPQIKNTFKWKVTLPSPYMFFKLCQNDSRLSLPSLSEEIIRLFKTVTDYLEERGVSMVQLDESYLPYHKGEKKEIDLFTRMITQIQSPKRNRKTAIHFFFGDAAPILNTVLGKIPIEAVGVDFYKTSFDDLPADFSCDLIAGVVDGRNSLLEKEKTITEFIKKLVKRIKLKMLYLTSNSDLEFLPEKIARKKLEFLGKLKNSL